MRSLLAIMSYSASTLACPDLAGRYGNCQSVGNKIPVPRELSLTQRSTQGYMSYYVMTQDESGQKALDTFKADGRSLVHKMSDPLSGMNISYTSKVACQGEYLEIETAVLNEKIRILFSKRGRKLTQKIMGDSKMSPPTFIICEQKS